MILKVVLSLLFLFNLAYSNTIEVMQLDKRINILEHKMKNVERQMIFMNENLKRIDHNFEKMILIINDNQYDVDSRTREVKTKNIVRIDDKVMDEKSVYQVLNDTYLYGDSEGKTIIQNMYIGELVDIESCFDCQGDNCLCKVRNQKAYIKLNNLNKNGALK